ncbi:MAG: hypothetical protein DRJ64_04075 [Thermoprotei archaeon]|nr:MAG: hypothetical protein DRJ64_04075 [Thermoprotei archaeon]
MKHYKNIEEAFYNTNYNLLFSQVKVGIAHTYNLQFYLEPVLTKEIDFTQLVNYTSTKWDGLVSNYLDFMDIAEFGKEVEERLGSKHWAETVKFSHNTKARKACLISATALNNGERNELFIHIRTSETYKRLMMDLLLFKRLGDFTFKGHDYIIHVVINHAWLSKDWASMLLVKPHIKVRCRNAEPGTIANKTYLQYTKFKNTDWKDLTYNAHKRAVRVIRKDVHVQRLLSTDCDIIQ